MTDTQDWRATARCRAEHADDLFVAGARQREARKFCRPCAVRTECLAHALDQRVEWGVWGGATERERRALLRTWPAVGSWSELLTRAREAHHPEVAGPQAPAAAPIALRATA